MDGLETNKTIAVGNSEQFLETKSCNHTQDISAFTEIKKPKKSFAHKTQKLKTQKMTKDKIILQRKGMLRSNKFSWAQQLSMPKPKKTIFSQRKNYSRVTEKTKNLRGRLLSDPRGENMVDMTTKHPDNSRALAANCISHAKNSSKNSPLLSNSRNTPNQCAKKTANKTVEPNKKSSKSMRMLSGDTRKHMSQFAHMEPAHNAMLDVSTADTPSAKGVLVGCLFLPMMHCCTHFSNDFLKWLSHLLRQ